MAADRVLKDLLGAASKSLSAVPGLPDAWEALRATQKALSPGGLQGQLPGMHGPAGHIPLHSNE